MDIWEDMARTAESMAAEGLLRRPEVIQSSCGPRVTIGGREAVCLCSNDYLGLAADPAVRAAAVEAVQRWGVGAGASRLVSGTTSLHAELERRLAAFKGAGAAVVTSTGWMANHVAVHALAGGGDLVLCDALDHASILDAARSCGAGVRTYPHGDVRQLAQILQRVRGRHRGCLIVTDSLFSMDGDLAPLVELAEVKQRFDAQLLIDEAHATGVLGEHGRGAAELLGVEDAIDATVGTLSKAIGSLGGFVAGPETLIETIRNTGRPYIYTTALPPALCAAALKSLEIIRDEPARRRKLLGLADHFRGLMEGLAVDTRGSVSQIVPVTIGEADEAVRVSRRLLDAGFFVPAIRPPTVPPGTSRLRVSFSAGHDVADADALAELLRHTR